MALTSTQQAIKLFKKLMGVTDTLNPDSGTGAKEFFNESILSRQAVYPSQIWKQYSEIPSSAPTGMTNLQEIGVVKYYQDLVLTAVPGSDSSYYNSELKNTIPFNFDPNGTYNYTLKNNINSTIPFGLNDWVVDTDAGVLMFYKGSPNNIPPKISFYKYIGEFGIGGMDNPEQYVSTGTTQIISGEKTFTSDIIMSGTTINFINNSGENIKLKFDGFNFIIVDNDLNEHEIVYKENNSLSGLTDVNINNLQDGDSLVYSGGTWINDEGIEATDLFYTKIESESNFLSANTKFSLSGLTDVNLNNILIGQGLIWNGSKWINGSSDSGFTIDAYTKSETNSNFLSATTINTINLILSNSGRQYIQEANPIYSGSSGSFYTGINLNKEPYLYSYINIMLNGISYDISYGDTNGVFYFESYGKILNDIDINDELWFNSNEAGFELDVDDQIFIVYTSIY